MRLYALFMLLPGSAFIAFGNETKINPSELPAAVQAAVKDQLKGGKVTGANKEIEHGRMEYEVETILNGKSRDLTFSEDGSLLELEEETELDSIPERAGAAIRKAAQSGRVKKVEAVTEHGVTSYEARVSTENGKTKEIAVNADGTPHKAD